jgi:hypothetical protein
MNAPVKKRRPTADRLDWPLGMIVALIVLGSGQLVGCADIRRATYLPPVNPESPVAGAVAAASTQRFKPPTFASVPPKPINIPTPGAVKTAVIDMVRCRRAYEAWAAANPALVSGTGAFAGGLQAQLDNNPADRPTPAEAAAAEADAASLRAYAEPPPPMKSGPPPTPEEAAPPTSAGPAHAQHRAAPVKTAAAAPAPAPPTTPPVAVSAAPAPAPEAVAIVQPSMTSLYDDPVLAHCQGASR